MDKIHTKTNKFLNEICKQKIKLSKNANKDFSKLSKDEITDFHIADKCCIYCEKVFFNSKYLMKHLLRRHSDELVLFYRNFTNRDFNYTPNDLQHLTDILQKEFSSLKKELCSANLAVEGKHETNSFEKNQIIGEERTTHTRTENNNGDNVSNEISDLKEKLLDVEKDIQNLNDKFIELENVLKNEVLKKGDIHEKLAQSEEKIMQAQLSQFNELRQILLTELKSILYNQQQDINSEWKSQLLELRYEIKRLDYAINNAQQITCIDSLKEELRKELMPQLIPHIKSTKPGKRKHHHLSAKSELFFNKSHSTSQQKKVSQEQNFHHEKSNSKSLENHPETSFKTVDKLTTLVADKLSEFSIAPNTSKLSSDEYNKISKYINFEKELLQKKYGNFSEIYDKINKSANQRAHSKLKSKKHHKIKFSDPLISSRIRLNHSIASFEDGMPEQSSSIQNLEGQFYPTVQHPLPSNSKNISREKMHPANESIGFLDKGASGDSFNPNSHKQKIAVKNTKSVKRFETSSPIADIVDSNDLTASFSYGDSAEQRKYKRQTNSISPVVQKEFNPPVNNCTLQLKEIEKFTFPDIGNLGESSPPVKKQIMPLKHTKLTNAKEFGNSSIKNSKSSKDLNVTFTKDNNILSAGQVNYKNQRKLNSAMDSQAVLFKENSILKTKALDKLSELDEYCNSDDEFDDVSSLETYKSSDDDKD